MPSGLRAPAALSPRLSTQPWSVYTAALPATAPPVTGLGASRTPREGTGAACGAWTCADLPVGRTGVALLVGCRIVGAGPVRGTVGAVAPARALGAPAASSEHRAEMMTTGARRPGEATFACMGALLREGTTGGHSGTVVARPSQVRAKQHRRAK